MKFEGGVWTRSNEKAFVREMTYLLANELNLLEMNHFPCTY